MHVENSLNEIFQQVAKKEKTEKSDNKEFLSCINTQDIAKKDNIGEYENRKALKVGEKKKRDSVGQAKKMQEVVTVKSSVTRQEMLEQAAQAKEEERLTEEDYTSLVYLLNQPMQTEMPSVKLDMDQFFSGLQEAGLPVSLADQGAVSSALSQSSSSSSGTISEDVTVQWEFLNSTMEISVPTQKSSDLSTELNEKFGVDQISLSPRGLVLKDKMAEAISEVKRVNEESAIVTPFPEFEEDESVSQIAPSGNLKAIKKNQQDILQVASPSSADKLMATNLVEPLEIDVSQTATSKKEMAAFLQSKETTVSVRENVLVQTSGAKGSILERINQVAMVQKIGARLQVGQLRDAGVVQMRLDPPELGHLLVKLSMQDKDLRITIVTENANTSDMLKSHKHVFMQAVKENGLEIKDFDIQLQNASGFTTEFQMNQDSQHTDPHETQSVSSTVVSEEARISLTEESPEILLSNEENRISLIA